MCYALGLYSVYWEYGLIEHCVSLHTATSDLWQQTSNDIPCIATHHHLLVRAVDAAQMVPLDTNAKSDYIFVFCVILPMKTMTNKQGFIIYKLERNHTVLVALQITDICLYEKWVTTKLFLIRLRGRNVCSLSRQYLWKSTMNADNKYKQYDKGTRICYQECVYQRDNSNRMKNSHQRVTNQHNSK